VWRGRNDSVTARVLIGLDVPDPTGRDVRVTDEVSAGWSIERIREYFDWAKSVINRVRGTNARLEKRFDQLYGMRP
jgi:hypothetical protein